MRKVCDRVLREWWEASSRPDFPCQNRVLAQGKRNLANEWSQEEGDRPLARPIFCPTPSPVRALGAAERRKEGAMWGGEAANGLSMSACCEGRPSPLIDYVQQFVTAPVAQPDRAFASGAKGRAFESRRAYHLTPLFPIGASLPTSAL